MPFAILAKPLQSLFADIRLGFRLALRRWNRLDRGLRNRIELGAIVSLLPLSAALAALAAAPSAVELDALKSTPVVEAIVTPPIADQVAELVRQEESFVREARVQRGETVAALLARLGITDEAAATFIRTNPSAQPLVRLAPGRFVQANISAQGRLNWLKVYSGGELDGETATTRVLTLDRSGEEWGFRVAESELILERRVELRSGSVHLTLFGAADDAGIPDSIAQQMIDALESVIDFHRDLRRGDAFHVVYEALYASGEYLRPGRLLAVDFTNAGMRRSAYWFGDGSKRGGFYRLDGESMKRALLRSPLEYTRVSSGFSSNRTHPIFGYDAAHRGVDHAAPTGTRIRSVGDGVVTFAGWQRGYGNVVEVRHDGKHSTLYAHLSAIAPGLRQGSRIAQGDLVGFVGMTGWATGPHLHYELKIHDRQVNPLTAELPGAPPLAGEQLAAFSAITVPLREQLALLERVSVALDAGR
jgi:murein DD-endopeptidase MepM/ murein hydrolase activator NlpD